MITLQADLHTHTIASGHAYSTIKEMAEAAEFKNIKIMATTDHAPAMPGSAKELHFGNLRSLPRRINNVLILRGVELNVLDLDGTIDLPEKVLNRLDWHIASLHENIFIPEGGADYTDYKFYCFHDEPKYLYVSKGLEDHSTARISFLNLDWTFAPFNRSDYKPFSELPVKPKNFNFFPCGGMMPFKPKEWDYKLGELINLPGLM